MAAPVRFGFTKVVTKDVEKLSEFYEAALGRLEKLRLETTLGGEPLDEVILSAPDGGGPILVLVNYVRRPLPHLGEVLLAPLVAPFDPNQRFRDGIGDMGQPLSPAVSQFALGTARR